MMGYDPCCLLCSESLSSALIPKGHGKWKELPEIFTVFCEYMKLDPDRNIQDEYRGKLFPFCVTCSFQVYQLFEYHQEKLRVLQLLTQMLASMTTAILGSQQVADDGQDQDLHCHPRSLDQKARSLSLQILSLRNRVVQNYSPKVRVDAKLPPVLAKKVGLPSSPGIDDSLGIGLRKKARKSYTEFESGKENDSDIDDIGNTDMDYDPEGDNPDTNAEDSDESWDEGKGRLSDPDFMDPLPDPEKTLADYEVSTSVYCFLDKYTCEKKAEDQFTCSSCDHVSDSWKAMYSHIREEHYDGPEKRAEGSVHQIGENLYEYRGKAYTRLEDGKFKCKTCDWIVTCRSHMKDHIKRRHKDYMPPEPDPEKSLEDYQVSPGIYCFSNQLRFERKGDQLSCARCNYESSCWKEMYVHMRKVHYKGPRKSPEERVAVVDPRVGGRVWLQTNESKRRDPGERLTQVFADLEVSPGHYSYKNYEFRFLDNKMVCGSCVFSCERSTRILSHITVKHVNNFGFVEVRPNEFLYTGKYPGVRGEDGTFSCKVEGCDSSGNSLGSFKKLREHILYIHCGVSLPEPQPVPRLKKHAVKKFQQAKSSVAEYEVEPNKYSFKGFGFTIRDGAFHCDSCMYDSSKSRYSVLTHLKMKHVENGTVRFEIVELRPGELLIGNAYPAFRTEDGSYKCGVGTCEFVTKVNCQICTHMRMKHDDSTVICDICGKVLKNKLMLQTHHKFVHKDEGELVCPTCGKIYRTPNSLKKHIRFVHEAKKRPSEKLHVCHVCGKAYHSRSNLSFHVEAQHSDKVPSFPCPQCGKVYKTPWSLSLHVKTTHDNAGRANHPCPICNKEFKYSETIRRHILVQHEGKRSSEVYKRKQRPSSSSTGRTRRSRSKVAKRDSETGSEVEEENDDFQSLINF